MNVPQTPVRLSKSVKIPRDLTNVSVSLVTTERSQMSTAKVIWRGERYIQEKLRYN